MQPPGVLERRVSHLHAILIRYRITRLQIGNATYITLLTRIYPRQVKHAANVQRKHLIPTCLRIPTFFFEIDKKKQNIFFLVELLHSFLVYYF